MLWLLSAGCTYRWLHDNLLIEADLWGDEPSILAATVPAFEGIIGVDGGEEEVRDAGGTWNTVACTDGQTPPRNVLTSSAESTGLDRLFSEVVVRADAAPIVFSWPVLAGTAQQTDFRLTLSTGESVIPESASVYPNFEHNERHVVVIFGEFGNRIPASEEGSVYATRIEVVEDETPLMLVGPDGPQTAVGLSFESDATGYDAGPVLVGAKLSRLSLEGEGGPRFLGQNLPNDARALYGEDAQFRLRVFTSGGFSPDGVEGVRPDQFSTFFRLRALAGGEPVMLTETGANYPIDGGTVRILGLADLGLPRDEADGIYYDPCYVEDRDNYIDIALAGDEAAMRSITHVEIPAVPPYAPFYNPGGPGNTPSDGVRYTKPGPPDLEPVILALDDPGVVSYSE